MGRAEFKVPGGKLLRARAEVKEGKIVFIRVTGDFFMTPENDLEDLEQMLQGSPAESKALSEAVSSFFAERRTSIIGASPSDFVHIILEALKD